MTPQFKKAFDVIRRLVEIKAQNLMLPSIQTSPLTRTSAQGRHQMAGAARPAAADAARHVPPHQRGFGPQPWDPASERDRILLYYLDRYCYRCHSSSNTTSSSAKRF